MKRPNPAISDVAAPRTPIEELRSLLTARFSPVRLEILDDSDSHAGHAGAREGGHYRLKIAAEEFRGRSRVESHRLVYDAVAQLMGRGIHALSIDARAPD